jgi:hypothetical protein
MVPIVFAAFLLVLACCLVIVAVQLYAVFRGDDSWQHRL